MVSKKHRFVEKTDMKPQILATGISGLVGTRVQELLQDKFEFTDLSLATGVDVTNYEDLENHIRNSPAKIILHMAAKTDVDGCEDDKIFGEEGKAWVINVTEKKLSIFRLISFL